MKEVHLFEPTGYAGIYQHAYQLALDLRYRDDVRVILHTAQQHERLSGEGVDICACSWWPQGNPRGRLRLKFKQLAIAARLAAITLPHLVSATKRGSVFHLQGPGAGGALNVLLLSAARLRGCCVVYSPHDTFSRRGRLDGKLLEACYRPAHAIIVYSRTDQEFLRKWRDRVYVAPLRQFVPQPSAEQLVKWRKEWQADDPKTMVVLCPGFIRPNRGLDVLVDSARQWPERWRLAVVGADRGGWARSAQLIQQWRLSVAGRIEFIELDEFAAAIAAADLVVVPSLQASQSGVLELARRLGTATVAADVGGMAELASQTFRAGNVDELTAAIRAQLTRPTTPAAPGPEHDLDAYLRAYGEIA